MATKKEKTAAAPWGELAAAMNAQAEGYEKFLVFLKDKERTIIKGDMKKLKKSADEEKEHIDKLDALEDRRMAAAENCIGVPGITLRELLERAPGEHRPALEEAAMRLIEAINKVAIANVTNAELIQEAMGFIEFNLNLLSSSGEPDEGRYESSGRLRSQDKNVKSILNKQV